MKTKTQIDWREWRDTRTAIEKLNQLLSPFGIQLNHSADPASDFFHVEAVLRSLGSASSGGAPRTAAKLEETASLYPDQEHNVLVAFTNELERENAKLREALERHRDALRIALSAIEQLAPGILAQALK